MATGYKFNRVTEGQGTLVCEEVRSQEAMSYPSKCPALQREP